MFNPLNKICPDVGDSNPANILKVVVLPHPEGPKRVTKSPLSMVRFIESTALWD
jgi:hypothetical protein